MHTRWRSTSCITTSPRCIRLSASLRRWKLAFPTTFGTLRSWCNYWTNLSFGTEPLADFLDGSLWNRRHPMLPPFLFNSVYLPNLHTDWAASAQQAKRRGLADTVSRFRSKLRFTDVIERL